MKYKTFRDKNIEIKSNWLRQPKDREKRYLKKYNVTADQLTQFTNDLHDWISEAPLTLVASVIDKIQMKERYGEKAWHPSATAYQFLMQRYEMHLDKKCHPVPRHSLEDCTLIGYVTVDNMDGASPAANQWRDLLRNHHRSLKKEAANLPKCVLITSLMGCDLEIPQRSIYFK